MAHTHTPCPPPSPRSSLVIPKLNTYPTESTICASSKHSIDDLEKAQALEHERGQFSFRKTLWIVTALMINQFLATSDATIVSTSLPTIVAELDGSQNEYAWVGVAYLLTQTACQPLYGKLADIIGRKPILFGSTFIFLLGSALCGAAKSMIWLIIARGISGVGGGGIVNSVWVLVTEIVPPGSQAKWSQALSVTWSASALAGPILGGIFSGQVATGFSWRWAFWINLPIGFAAMAVLAFCLRSVPIQRKMANGSLDTRPWREAYIDTLRTFDYLGLLLLMGGTSVLVIGFSFAGQDGWKAPRTLGLIISGIVGLIAACIYEAFRGPTALLPPGIFRQLTVILVLAISVLHNFAFTAGTYYIPLFYQAVHGSSPFAAGMRMLPFSLGSALASIPTAQFISYKKGARWTDWSLRIAITTGLALSIIGYGLMITLNQHSQVACQEMYPLIAGIGIGMLFHTPFQIVTNSLPKNDLASATGAFFLVRFIGTTTGLSVAGAIFDSNWFSNMPNEFLHQVSNPRTIDLRTLVQIPSPELREAVLSAVSLSISRIWIVCTPCLGFGLILAIFMRVRHHESHTLCNSETGGSTSQSAAATSTLNSFDLASDTTEKLATVPPSPSLSRSQSRSQPLTPSTLVDEAGLISEKEITGDE